MHARSCVSFQSYVRDAPLHYIGKVASEERTLRVCRCRVMFFHFIVIPFPFGWIWRLHLSIYLPKSSNIA